MARFVVCSGLLSNRVKRVCPVATLLNELLVLEKLGWVEMSERGRTRRSCLSCKLVRAHFSSLRSLWLLIEQVWLSDEVCLRFGEALLHWFEASVTYVRILLEHWSSELVSSNWKVLTDQAARYLTTTCALHTADHLLLTHRSRISILWNDLAWRWDRTDHHMFLIGYWGSQLFISKVPSWWSDDDFIFTLLVFNNDRVLFEIRPWHRFRVSHDFLHERVLSDLLLVVCCETWCNLAYHLVFVSFVARFSFSGVTLVDGVHCMVGKLFGVPCFNWLNVFCLLRAQISNELHWIYSFSNRLSWLCRGLKDTFVLRSVFFFFKRVSSGIVPGFTSTLFVS